MCSVLRTCGRWPSVSLAPGGYCQRLPWEALPICLMVPPKFSLGLALCASGPWSHCDEAGTWARGAACSNSRPQPGAKTVGGLEGGGGGVGWSAAGVPRGGSVGTPTTFSAFGTNPFPQNLKLEKDGFENFGGSGGGGGNSNGPPPCSWATEILQYIATVRRVVGSGDPSLHYLTSWGHWAVELRQCIASMLWSSAQRDSFCTLPHCLGAVGMDLLQYTTTLLRSSGRWMSFSTLPHCLRAVGIGSP